MRDTYVFLNSRCRKNKNEQIKMHFKGLDFFLFSIAFDDKQLQTILEIYTFPKTYLHIFIAFVLIFT